MDINQLDKITKVEVPDIVFARLQQKIEMARQDILSTPKAVLLSAAFTLVLSANFYLLNNSKAQLSTSTSNESLTDVMGLNTNPNLYHE